MSDWMDTFPEKLGTFFSIFLWGAICLVFMSLIGSFMYDAFHTPSEFHELNVKAGVLTHVGGRIHRKGGRSYIPADITVNGIKEVVKLPLGQQVSLLSDDIGEVIEIRSDPRHISFLARGLNVWHVSSKKRTYFDYNKAFEKFVAHRNHEQNIIYILGCFNIIIVIKNFHALRNQVSLLFRNGIPKQTEPGDQAVFEPCNMNNGVMLWVFSIPTIMIMYYGFFLHPVFLIFGVPLAALEYFLYRAMRKNIHRLYLSPAGITYEPLKQAIKKDTLAWSEIEDIGTFKHKGVELIMVKLRDRTCTSIIAKIGNLSYDLNIGLSKFESSDSLKQVVFEMYDLYKTKNTESGMANQEDSPDLKAVRRSPAPLCIKTKEE